MKPLLAALGALALFLLAVTPAHVDQPHRHDPWPWRLGIEEARGLTGDHRSPEVPLSGDQEVLVERVGRDPDIQPMATAGDDRERRLCGSDDPHAVLELSHMLGDRPFLREGPRQHEFGLENRPGVLVSGSNSWTEFAGMFRRTRAAHAQHEKAKAELKALMPEDAREATGHGVRAKRSKSGSVSFDLLAMEDNGAPIE
jgi:hypothetical protein